jgi:DNA-binding CsgD family transcriptional regulator
MKAISNKNLLHGIMLPSLALIFISSNYLILNEIGPLIRWHHSVFWLHSLLLMGFGVSWIYTFHINKAYQKVQAVVAETETSEAILQAKLKTLSRKEREVLNLILADKTNQEISDELYISLSTLKTHINHIYKKLEVNTRKEIFSALK